MNPESEADSFNQILSKDGYRLTLEYGAGWTEGNKYVRANPYFKVVQIVSSTLATESLLNVSHEGINEQIAKVNRRVESGDYAGAIASAYTLVEQLLKLMLAEFNPGYNTGEGDIRALYKDVRVPLGLDPSSDKIEGVLKPILDGFQKLVGGLYEMSNKASDRHARNYNPAIHHAKLAVNAAFVLCEFLVDTKLYQEGRSK